MDQRQVETELCKDDPAASQHHEWHGLVGHFVMRFGTQQLASQRSLEHPRWKNWDIPMWDVLAARCSDTQAFLRIRRWPCESERWIGGMLDTQGGMTLCEDGFQVASERYVVLEAATVPTTVLCALYGAHLKPDNLEQLRLLLDRRPSRTDSS